MEMPQWGGREIPNWVRRKGSIPRFPSPSLSTPLPPLAFSPAVMTCPGGIDDKVVRLVRRCQSEMYGIAPQDVTALERPRTMARSPDHYLPCAPWSLQRVNQAKKTKPVDTCDVIALDSGEPYGPVLEAAIQEAFASVYRRRKKGDYPVALVLDQGAVPVIIKKALVLPPLDAAPGAAPVLVKNLGIYVIDQRAIEIVLNAPMPPPLLSPAAPPPDEDEGGEGEGEAPIDVMDVDPPLPPPPPPSAPALIDPPPALIVPPARRSFILKSSRSVSPPRPIPTTPLAIAQRICADAITPPDPNIVAAAGMVDDLPALRHATLGAWIALLRQAARADAMSIALDMERRAALCVPIPERFLEIEELTLEDALALYHALDAYVGKDPPPVEVVVARGCASATRAAVYVQMAQARREHAEGFRSLGVHNLGAALERMHFDCTNEAAIVRFSEGVRADLARSEENARELSYARTCPECAHPYTCHFLSDAACTACRLLCDHCRMGHWLTRALERHPHEILTLEECPRALDMLDKAARLWAAYLDGSCLCVGGVVPTYHFGV